MASAPFWIGANVLLVTAAWRLSKRFFSGEGAEWIAVHGVVAGWACVVGSAMALGSVGALSGPAILTAVTATALAALHWSRGPDPDVPQAEAAPPGSVTRWGWVRVFLIGFLLAQTATAGVGRFQFDWDTLMYHGPLIDQWLQRRSLYASDCYNWSHPGNNELVGLWAVAPFSGDFLIGLTNLPSAVLLVLSSETLGRAAGLSDGLSRLAAVAVVGNAVVFRQVLDAENDLAVAGLFLACLGYGLRFARGGRAADLAWGGMSLGLLAGTKFYALGYAALALAAAAGLTAVVRGPRAALSLASAWLSGFALWGGYWYLRNAVLGGSPLYPAGLTPTSGVISHIYPDIRHSSILGCGRPEVLPLMARAFWNNAGPCQVAAFLAAPVTTAWLALGASGPQQADRFGRWSRRVLALVLAGSLALLVITPFAAEDSPGTLNHLTWGYTPVRFGLCFLSLAILALSVAIQDLTRGLNRFIPTRYGPPHLGEGHSEPTGGVLPADRLAGAIAGAPSVLWAVVVVAQFVVHAARRSDDAIVNAAVAAGAVEIIYLVRSAQRLSPGLRARALAAAIVVLGVGATWTCGRLSDDWRCHFSRHYDHLFSTGVLEALASQDPPPRICVVFYRPYPFYGPIRQFRVFQPMWAPSPSWFLGEIAARHVDAVVFEVNGPVYNGWNNFKNVDRFYVKTCGKFDLFYVDRHFEVYLDRSRRGHRRQNGTMTPVIVLAVPR